MTTPSEDTPINTYLGPSVLAFLLFWPLGIVALVFSIMAQRTASADSARSQQYALRAANWGMLTMLVWLCLLVGMLVFTVVFRGAGLL